MHLGHIKQFCLTIRESTERNERVKQRFIDNNLDVEFYYGVNGQTIGIQPIRTCFDVKPDNSYRINPGKTSITISKMMLFQHILDKGYDEVLIYENDVTFCEDYQQSFDRSYEALPPDWRVAHVGSCCINDKPTTIINDRISEIKHPLCCHAILWKKEAIRQAYESFKIACWGTPSDSILARAVYPKLRHYTFTPPLAFQEESKSEAGQTVYWSDIQGWFDYQRIYDEQLDGFGDNPAVVVEVGCWLGKSTAYFAEEIKRRLKPVTFYAVDTWKGSANESGMQETLQAHQGDIFSQFTTNMARCGVSDYVKPLRMPSVEAAKQFKDGSVDFVFIDADHSYEAVKSDILAWLPKVHYHRTMAGHDIERESVQKAVNEVFGNKWRRWENVWIVDHCHT